MRRALNNNPTQTSTHGQAAPGSHFGKHLGYDYLVKNVPVFAPVSGKVTLSGWSNSLGNWIELAGSDGRTHRFAHLSRRDASNNQTVSEGHQLGITGNTGQVTGSNGGYHLHHDVRKAGTVWNASFDNYYDWEKLLASQPSTNHRYQYLVDKTITQNGFSVYKEGTDEKLGKLAPGDEYVVRGVSVRHNRVLINSAKYGNGISLPLADAAGNEYTGEWKVL